MNRLPRILLGQLGSFGDCLYATAIARQIKEDYSGCHLTWAIGSPYRSVLTLNPHVDEVWEIAFRDRREMDAAWRMFERQAQRRYRSGEFDQMFLTQLGPNNYQNFDGTIRSSLFRSYPHPITVPVDPVVRLSDDEVDSVRRFAEHHRLAQFRHVVLFEYSAESKQSFVNQEFALRCARGILARLPDAAFILSSSQPIASDDPRIIDGSTLSFRENAELTKHCSLLVGCSSGVSWLCTSDWARPLPMIQLLKSYSSVFASMAHDAAYFGRSKETILEMTDCTIDRLVECLSTVLTNGFPQARQMFHEEIPVKLDMYFEVFMLSVLKQGQPLKALRSMRHVYRRYGIQPFKDYWHDIFASV